VDRATGGLAHISTRALRLIIWVVGVSAVINAMAQDVKVSLEPRARPTASKPDAANRSDPSFRASGDLVLIPVMVTDSQDRLVTGLEKEHFKLFEDQAEQPITQFASEDAPVSVGLVFDCSGSMGDKLQKSRAAVAEFLKIANPEDEFSLVVFSDTARLVVPLTDRSGEIENRLAFMQSKGQTALLDAVYLAMHEMKHAQRSRKALLIISDGGDNSSRYTSSEIKKMVRETDVQIYSIGILEPLMQRSRTAEELAGPELLRNIAQQSGGRLFEVENLNELPDIASKIGMALRNQYLLGYAPAADKKDGKYHRIQVKMAQPKGIPPMRVSFRSGYFAPAQ
jgi:Ca-activated chloride channel family protein